MKIHTDKDPFYNWLSNQVLDLMNVGSLEIIKLSPNKIQVKIKPPSKAEDEGEKPAKN